MRLRRLCALVCAMVVFVCAPAARAAISVPTGFVVEDAVPGSELDTPVGIAFLPDGRLLVGEKRGRVLLVENGLARTLWSGEGEVLDANDRGLVDVAVDPDYFHNHYVYFLYTADPDSNGVDDDPYAYGRLTRYQVGFADSNVVLPGSRTVLMGTTWSTGSPSCSPSHTVGSLRFGRDGSLLVSIGDGASYTQVDSGGMTPEMFGPNRVDRAQDIGAFRAQSLASPNGKILRIDPATGRGYPSNPFWNGDPNATRSKIWAYGLRNPFRFTVRPGTGAASPSVGDPGAVVIGDVGWNACEEIDVADAPGKNFGWPCQEGVETRWDYQWRVPVGASCPASPAAPWVAWHHRDSTVSVPVGLTGSCAIGGAYYTGSIYPPGYRGRYFFADYNVSSLRVLFTDGAGQPDHVQEFGADAEGPVDLVANPVNGDLYYVAIYRNQVRRIRYEGDAAESAPVARATADPYAGPAPLVVHFSSDGSEDPNGDPLATSWLFGDQAGSSLTNPVHTYTTAGVYRAVLTVEDGLGGLGRDTVFVVVGDDPYDFPGTPVRDAFAHDGPLGTAWVGDRPAFAVGDSELVAIGGGSIVWADSVFGANQEAYVTVRSVTAAEEVDLMLKVQGPAWSDGHIEVRYDPDRSQVRVSTYTPGAGWSIAGTFDERLHDGDRFGARATAAGVVEVFVNEAHVGSVPVGGWPYAASAGRIGLTLVSSGPSSVDDFGGGTAPVVPNARPRAFVEGPADGTTYVAGDTLRLDGIAGDDHDASDSLAYRWQIDLHHHQHVHPSSFVSASRTAAYVADNHDDGTGIWLEALFIATDRGGLRDTARTHLYPEIDLEPSAVTATPETLSAVAPTTFRFRLANRGRMPAPLSRWMLVVDAVELAQGDTLVAARDSVAIEVAAFAAIAAGRHDLRVVVDTLAAVHETDEGNNARVRSVEVRWAALDVGSTVAGVALSAAYPNPTSGAARMTLDVPAPAAFDLTIHDLQGRVVWRDPRPSLAAGRWTLGWSGLEGGRRARAGLYFARVTLGGRVFTRRIALLR